MITHVPGPLAWVLFCLGLGCVVGLAIAAKAYRRRTTDGFAFAGAGVSVALWCGTAVAGWLFPDTAVRILISKLQYVGICALPPLTLLATLSYVAPEIRWRGWSVFGLWFVPCLTILLAWTNEFHHLIWTRIDPMEAGGVTWLRYGHGPVFYLATSAAYAVLAISFFAAHQAAALLPALFRSQTRWIWFGVLPPIIGNALYLGHLLPLSGFDPTPVGMSFGVAVWGITLLRHRLLEISPHARGMVIESMEDGVLVLDSAGRLTEVNPAARALLGRSDAQMLGQAITQVLPNLHFVSREFHREARADIRVPENGNRHLDVRCLPLHPGGRQSGSRLLVLRDVSERRLAEAELREKGERLRSQLAEIEELQYELEELSLRDPLTGLYNRRFFEERMEAEFEKARRDQAPLGLLVLDVDKFKQVNDRFGHAAGDSLLVCIGTVLRALFRSGGLPCRIGGDEFAVLMPGSDLRSARRSALELSTALRGIGPNVSGSDATSVSLGVAVNDATVSGAPELFRAADAALYASKVAGGDRVTSAGHATARSG